MIDKIANVGTRTVVFMLNTREFGCPSKNGGYPKKNGGRWLIINPA